MSQEDNLPHGEQMNFDNKRLLVFFIVHLNKIYCAKQHLSTRLPQLLEEAHFEVLKSAIEQTVHHVDKELSRLEIIYTLLDAEFADCSGTELNLFDGAFEAIQHQPLEKELTDLSILFYLQNIESIQMASFQILQMAAIRLGSKALVSLIKENYEDAKGNRVLLLHLTSQYLMGGA